jgi:hypothetical protein
MATFPTPDRALAAALRMREAIGTLNDGRTANELLRNAYRRYKDLLVRRGALERWYDFSTKSEETALREWCAENGIELSET